MPLERQTPTTADGDMKAEGPLESDTVSRINTMVSLALPAVTAAAGKREPNR